MDDAKLIKMLAEGSEDGLTLLMRQYQGLAAAVIRKILFSREQDVEECLADTFVSVWNYRHKLKSDATTLKGLIVCTARNAALDRYRKLKREQAIAWEDLELASDMDVYGQLEQKYDAEVIETQILSLAEPGRTIFVKRHYLMQSVRTIAADLNLRERQVTNSLYQSRLKLKELLSKRGIQE